jgi:hypothetical protein
VKEDLEAIAGENGYVFFGRVSRTQVLHDALKLSADDRAELVTELPASPDGPQDAGAQPAWPTKFAVASIARLLARRRQRHGRGSEIRREIAEARNNVHVDAEGRGGTGRRRRMPNRAPQRFREAIERALSELGETSEAIQTRESGAASRFAVFSSGLSGPDSSTAISRVASGCGSLIPASAWILACLAATA